MSSQWSEIREDYERDGFVIVRQFLSGGELKSLQDELVRYIQEVAPLRPPGEVYYAEPGKSETLKQMHRMELDSYFQEYQKSPRWKELAEQLLGESVFSHGVEWFNKPPGGSSETPPHQDNYYFCLTPPKVLTMWLALDEINEESGCLRYLPGSHRSGVRTHAATQTSGFSQGIAGYSPEEIQQEVAACANPGDLLVHHGNTIHRADVNRSLTRHRRSFAMVFQADSCQRDEVAFDRYASQRKQQQHQLGLV